MKSFEGSYTKVITGILAAGLGSTMLAGCSSGHEKNTSLCTNVGFGSLKGGPGSIIMDVYPMVKPGNNVEYGFGMVVEGNDKGEPIQWNNNGAASPHGEFVFSFDPNTKRVQSSKVEFSVIVDTTGQTQECPTTTVKFDQSRDLITPTYK
ncbi:MAG TPA: hypothetical protein VFI84_00500 [Candidatus Saccharimonadales bacterium]|nr:hypothetical protein [Candidatus Saccharimonadales bacterium]